MDAQRAGMAKNPIACTTNTRNTAEAWPRGRSDSCCAFTTAGLNVNSARIGLGLETGLEHRKNLRLETITVDEGWPTS
jgi:hypothetical protein